jgi:predicted DNA binding protein
MSAMTDDRTPADSGSEGDLTADQVALLRDAVRRGYFAVPRRVALSELATAHGLSDVEASERLRRGVETVLADRLLDGTEA